MIIVMRKSNLVLIGLFCFCFYIQPEHGCGLQTAMTYDRAASDGHH